MRAAVLSVLLVTAGAGAAGAQGATEETLRQAKARYEALDIERALLLFRQVVSPSSPFEVTPAQRAEAYKYLAASLAIVGMRDSAIVYFRAALERDPFIDLDPTTFTPDQIAAFGEARRMTFALAARPIARIRLDPRTEHYTFRILSTQATGLRVELRQVGAGSFVLYNGDNEGLREIQWDGLIGGGRLAPAGRYEVAVLGQNRLRAQSESTFVYFDVRHEFQPLEDTLPDLKPDELLPERYPTTAAARDLFCGLGVSVAALLISRAMPASDSAGYDRAFSNGVAGAGLATGLIAFVVRQGHRDIVPNMQENARRRSQRATANAAIRQRNQSRLAETVLLLEPAAGAGR